MDSASPSPISTFTAIANNDKNEQPKKIKWNDLDTSTYSWYGASYILLTNTLLYPSELLRTRLQADKFTTNKKIIVRKLFMDIYKREGIGGLYKGYMSACQLIYYVSYEYSNQMFLDGMPNILKSRVSDETQNVFANAMSGMTAEAAGAFIYVPSDVVSQRLQVQNRVDFIPLHLRQTSAIAISKYIWRNEGIKGFYRGYIPYLLVFGPGSAVWWGSYEIFKRNIHSCLTMGETFASSNNIFRSFSGFGMPEVQAAKAGNLPIQDNSISLPFKKEINHFVSGALAGVCSVLVTNPLDVSRTRMQLLEYKNEKDKSALKKGFFNMLGEVYKREGLYGFYKGVKPRIFVSIPGSAIAFVGYEYLKETSIQKSPDVNK